MKNKIMLILGFALVAIGLLIIANASTSSNCQDELNRWEKIDSTNQATIKTYQQVVKENEATIETYRRIVRQQQETFTSMDNTIEDYKKMVKDLQSKH